MGTAPGLVADLICRSGRYYIAVDHCKIDTRVKYSPTMQKFLSITNLWRKQPACLPLDRQAQKVSNTDQGNVSVNTHVSLLVCHHRA